MKLFTKKIEEQLQKQYSLGSDMENQKVICKLFHPFHNWVWYIMNQDPNDPDYLWGIVKGYEVECGSISRLSLTSLRIKGLPLERDLYFKPRKAVDVYNDLLQNKHV